VHVTIFFESLEHLQCLLSFFDPAIEAGRLFFVVGPNCALIESHKFPLLLLEEHIDDQLVKLLLYLLAILAGE
jgi:hypothetical protein